MGARRKEQDCCTMYALFSKGFGKKGNDLLKREFGDSKFQNKMTTKAKAGDGTEFEANFSDKCDKGAYNDADFKVTHPVDDGLKLAVKTTAKGDVELPQTCSSMTTSRLARHSRTHPRMPHRLTSP